MNLIKEIEKEHSKAQCNKVVEYVGKSPTRFNKLVDLFLKGPYRVTQRSAWPLSYCVERHPELILPHLKKILKFIRKPGVHDAVKRNTMRLLQFIDPPKNLQGSVADISFNFLCDTKQPVAIRVFAMTVLANLCKTMPELKNELILIIEDQMLFAGPAFIARGKKVLKVLKN